PPPGGAAPPPRGGARLGAPALDEADRRRLAPAGAPAAALLGADQAALLEHLQVLDDRRQRDRERPGQLANRGRSSAEPLDDAAAGGGGQRGGDAGERDGPRHGGAPPAPPTAPAARRAPRPTPP